MMGPYVRHMKFEKVETIWKHSCDIVIKIQHFEFETGKNVKKEKFQNLCSHGKWHK